MKVSKAGKIWLDYHQSDPFQKKIQSEPTRSSRIDFAANSVITTLTIYLWTTSWTS